MPEYEIDLALPVTAEYYTEPDADWEHPNGRGGYVVRLESVSVWRREKNGGIKKVDIMPALEENVISDIEKEIYEYLKNEL